MTRSLVAVTLLNVCVAAGFSLVGLVQPTLILPPGAHPDASTTLFAAYAAARSLALTVAVLIAILAGKADALRTLGFLAGGIQGLDALVGILRADAFEIIGPAAICLLQLWVLRRAVADDGHHA